MHDYSFKSSRQRGFTLIEVLVAGLVLSVGVLGVAGLQITALKNLQSSQSYAVAAMLANDIADRMWVNPDQAQANAYNTPAAANPPDCVAGTCTTAELAHHDITDWQQQIVGYTLPDSTVIPGLLPSGNGTVAQIGVSSSYLVTLRWDDDHSGSTDTTCPPVDESDLDCYTLTITF